LPDNILRRMLRFANECQNGRMVTNHGLLPAQDQLLAARQWIEKLLQQTANKTA